MQGLRLGSAHTLHATPARIPPQLIQDHLLKPLGVDFFPAGRSRRRVASVLLGDRISDGERIFEFGLSDEKVVREQDGAMRERERATYTLSLSQREREGE